MKKLKIAIVVHGRFHAFDLAKALLAQGHDVTLFTNYPKWAVARFGIDKQRVKSFWLHGIVSRLFQRAGRWGVPMPEAWLHRCFGRWAAKTVLREEWDIIHSWSGISEELLSEVQPGGALALLGRGSAHIATQSRLLQEEEARTGIPLDRPSSWMIEREMREYDLSDYILVLSSFAWETFLQQGIPDTKLKLSPLGVDVSAFRPSLETINARLRRLKTDEPLHILYTGTKSFQKGMWDLVQVIQRLPHEHFRFRLVGPAPLETIDLLRTLGDNVTLVPSLPQAKLPEQYAWADMYLFPTLQDGFAVVLSQALASALPIITTTNCSGPDIIEEGWTGWIVPIRDPDAIVERLAWCHEHRDELANMVRHSHEGQETYTWTDSARDFVQVATACMRERAQGTPVAGDPQPPAATPNR